MLSGVQSPATFIQLITLYQNGEHQYWSGVREIEPVLGTWQAPVLPLYEHRMVAVSGIKPLVITLYESVVQSENITAINW